MKWTDGELEATQLMSGTWAVRPKGQLGTCGFHPRAWIVCYVKAGTAEQAIKRATRIINDDQAKGPQGKVRR